MRLGPPIAAGVGEQLPDPGDGLVGRDRGVPQGDADVQAGPDGRVVVVALQGIGDGLLVSVEHGAPVAVADHQRAGEQPRVGQADQVGQVAVGLEDRDGRLALGEGLGPAAAAGPTDLGEQHRDPGAVTARSGGIAAVIGFQHDRPARQRGPK